MFAFLGPIGLFLGVGIGFKTALGSIHVVEQLSISIVPSILTFDLIFGYFFLLFGALIGYFLGQGRVEKLFRGLFI